MITIINIICALDKNDLRVALHIPGIHYYIHTEEDLNIVTVYEYIPYYLYHDLNISF